MTLKLYKNTFWTLNILLIIFLLGSVLIFQAVSSSELNHAASSIDNSLATISLHQGSTAFMKVS
ncbi:hypothetical protein OAO18_07465 [Francisellaceae bacterium]|nr:hypothetical protein [Francisellaceae bacterium]